MRTFWIKKLIRKDLLPDMERRGHIVTYRRLDDTSEFLDELGRKLVEEATEASAEIKDPEKLLVELADVQELVETIADELGVGLEGVRKVQAERRAERGGFEERIYVEKVTGPEGEPIIEYYAAHPERFPEEK